MKNKKHILFVSTVAVFAGCLAPQASAGDCDCNNGPCIPCSGLDQTPDYRFLNTFEQDLVTEDVLNGPWIQSITRLEQFRDRCVGGSDDDDACTSDSDCPGGQCSEILRIQPAIDVDFLRRRPSLR